MFYVNIMSIDQVNEASKVLKILYCLNFVYMFLLLFVCLNFFCLFGVRK